MDASVNTRSQSQLYLLKQPVSELSDIRLASNGEVLGVFCNLHLTLGEPKRQAASSVVEQAMTIWNRARVPTCRKDHAIVNLEKLYEEWTALKRHKSRQTALQATREGEFCTKMNNLFDIAHADALNMIKIEEDRNFLLAQREPGRRGYMGSVDKALAAKEERKARRIESEKKRRERTQNEASASAISVVLSSSEDEQGDHESHCDETEHNDLNSPLKKKTRATVNVITPKLASALDRTKMSDRMATFVLAETVHSLGHNIDKYNINRSSIKRQREKHRAQYAAALKIEFSGDIPLVVHWDGKLMADISGNAHVDRLPVIVTGHGVAQLLKVSKMPDGTGAQQSSAVVQALEEWSLKHRVVGMCFDTTSSNTGRHSGACVQIEQKLGRDLLYFACRHHMMELLVGAAFTVCLSPTSAPEVLLFKRFKQQWSFIDHSTYSPCEEFERLSVCTPSVKDNIVQFAVSQLLQNKSLRGDYREFVELSIIFLGASPPRGVHFMTPGPMHNARWMSKVIYSLKVYLFRAQFKLTPFEEKGLLQMCIFAVILYLKAWITAPLASSAPSNDLSLLQELYSYRQHNEAISVATCKKMEGHLWYLSEQLVGLAFFDSSVSLSTKRNMVKALKNQPENEGPPLKRITIVASSASEFQLENFVTRNTMQLFEKLRITVDFLEYDPELWSTRDDYSEGAELIQQLHVTNDHAERGVALVQELNQRITHDEDQFQCLLQVVADHRRQYSCQKSKLK